MEYGGMVNPVEVCKTIGIDEEAFTVLFEYDQLVSGKMATPYVVTHIAGGRPVTPEALYDENMLLYEAEMLFEAQMKELALELNSIRQYRAMMFGPVRNTNEDTNNQGSDNDSQGTNTGQDGV